MKSLVRHEPPTLLERLERKAKDVAVGSYIPVTPGELKSARKTGATLTEKKGVWRWRSWLLIGEHFGNTETKNPTMQVDDWGFAPAEATAGIDDIYLTRQEAQQQQEGKEIDR